jgi:hypothetical protein
VGVRGKKSRCEREVKKVSGVASSASREESEEMYSGMSSVPMISSGSKSRLKEERKEEVKRKIIWETRSKSR